jgi:DNA-binding TFAR19-related protein (PDSD5 family)
MGAKETKSTVLLRQALKLLKAQADNKKASELIVKIEELLGNGSSVDKLDQFLENWKVQAKEFYTQLRVTYLEERSKTYEITEENLKELPSMNSRKPRYTDEKIAKILSDIEQSKNESYEMPYDRLMTEEELKMNQRKYMPGGQRKENLLSEIRHHKFNSWKAKHTKSNINIVERMTDEEFLENFLTKEVESLKKHFIATVEKKGGKMIDTSLLNFGPDGSLNGYVTCEIKNVHVQTIYAGGHSVQCLHYRVLVK